MIAPGPVVPRTFAKSRRDVSITVDYVTLQREGRRFARKEVVEVDRSDCFLVRGWAADLERKQLLGSVLIGTSRGVCIGARSSVGREDLLNVTASPVSRKPAF